MQEACCQLWCLEELLLLLLPLRSLLLPPHAHSIHYGFYKQAGICVKAARPSMPAGGKAPTLGCSLLLDIMIINLPPFCTLAMSLQTAHLLRRQLVGVLLLFSRLDLLLLCFILCLMLRHLLFLVWCSMLQGGNLFLLLCQSRRKRGLSARLLALLLLLLHHVAGRVLSTLLLHVPICLPTASPQIYQLAFKKRACSRIGRAPKPARCGQQYPRPLATVTILRGTR